MNRHEVELPVGFVEQKSDNQILSIALGLKQKDEKVVFIKKDINLRIKSEILNIETQDYEKSKVKIDELCAGWREISVPAWKIDQLYKDEKLVLKQDFYPNEFIVLKDEAGSSKSALTKYSGIRGRSLPQQYIIIDDAQNLTPHEIKTITSRAGNDTKIVLTGDPCQIDNPYLDASSNGFTYLVERFKGQEIFGHVTFSKSERSALAALSSELL
jgi:predicted ribonuclease YlaK